MNLCAIPGCYNFGRYCRLHKSQEIKPATSIKKVSDKTSEVLRKKYMPIARLFIKQHPKCQAKLEGCTKDSKTIHHKRGRLGELLIDTNNFLACCFNCHRIIEDNPDTAKEMGLSNSRLKK